MIINPYAFDTGPNAWEAAVIALSPLVWLQFNEISGSTFADSSGNGNVGFKQGTPALNQPPIFINMEASALFNSGAADQYVTIADNASLRFATGDFMVMHAFKRAGTMGGTFPKLAWKPTDPANGFANYAMIYNKATDKIIGRVTHSGSTNVDATSTTTFADATPYLVGYRRVGQEMSLWVNGTKEVFTNLPSPSTALDISGNVLDFFGGPSGGGDPFTAYGDEAIVVSGTVSDGSMAALWAARQ